VSNQLDIEARLKQVEQLLARITATQKGVMSISQGWDGEHLVVRKLTITGGFVPASMADADAENNTIYYSTTASKLVFKDSAGVVNNLY